VSDDGGAMQYSEGKIGRVFTLRLEEGERVPDVIEEFAGSYGIRSALVTFLGGAAEGSRLIVGPEKNTGDVIVPMTYALQGIHEILAVGTLFPNEEGRPVLHMHAAAGREGRASMGCTRAGVDVWLIGEVVILEILGISGQRRKSPGAALELLHLGLPHIPTA